MTMQMSSSSYSAYGTMVFIKMVCRNNAEWAQMTTDQYTTTHQSKS